MLKKITKEKKNNHATSSTTNNNKKAWKRKTHMPKGRKLFLMRQIAPRNRWQAYVKVVMQQMLKR
jgi:hypothetical protein